MNRNEVMNTAGEDLPQTREKSIDPNRKPALSRHHIRRKIRLQTSKHRNIPKSKSKSKMENGKWKSNRKP